MDVKEAKIIAMVALGVGSFLAGILPAWLSPLARQRCPLFLSCLLCWGGGVLLATSLVHMLPEARETLPGYAELAFCGGFFLVYLVDELVHFFCGDRTDSRNRGVSNETARGRFVNAHHGHSHHAGRSQNAAYGACETSNLLHDGKSEDLLGFGDTHTSCHVSHDEPCMRSSAGVIGLLLALLLHSVLEGLAIGLQSVGSKVLLLVGAVASHKLVVGFCLGVELSATGRGSICSHIVSIMIFSLGSVVGIATGMFIEGSNEFWTQSALGVLQSLAAGTLLYVTVSEVLPRERAKWHHTKKHAGLIQLIATILGFLIMYNMITFFDA